MRGIRGSPDGRHGGHLGDLLARRQHGSATQAVSQQELRGFQALSERASGGHQVGHVRAEGGVRELALALPEPREVERERRDPMRGERARDRPNGEEILGAGEAVREERRSAKRARRPTQARRERMSLGAVEGECLFHAEEYARPERAFRILRNRAWCSRSVPSGCMPRR